MYSSKPISTISYNSENFLKNVLFDLVNSGLISNYMYIYHLPDEEMRKEHCHILLFPTKRIQTNDIKNLFNEFDITHPSKPLGVLDFRNSTPNDWCLYAIHDEMYLSWKNMTRTHIYSQDHIHCYSEESKSLSYFEAYEWLYQQLNNKRVKAFRECMTFEQALTTGLSVYDSWMISQITCANGKNPNAIIKNSD